MYLKTPFYFRIGITVYAFAKEILPKSSTAPFAT